MNTNVVITLDTRRSKKDGTFPIMLRLSHHRKTIPIPIGYTVPEKFWDRKNRKIRTSYKGMSNIARVNNLIEKEKAKALDIITKLEDQNKLNFLSIKEVKERINKKNSQTTFFDYTTELIKDLIEKQKIGNARSYSNVLREVKKFCKKRDFKFYEFNYAWLIRFESAYLSRGLSENGLAVYMRTLRAIFNKAVREGIAEKEGYPFADYTIKTKPTKKRAITQEAIERIVNLDLESGTGLFDARNFFLASFYTMGASFIDLAFLKVANLVDGRVQYQRQKTGRYYDIRIEPQLQKILDHYIIKKEKEDFIFPIIKREGLLDQYKDIQWAQNRYNKRLKRIAGIAKIDENLTSYVSRHSFATLADQMEIPLTAISQMMGHERVSTTQVYLASLRSNVLDDYNERIITH